MAGNWKIRRSFKATVSLMWLWVEDNLAEQWAGSLQGSCSHYRDRDFDPNIQRGNPRTSTEWVSDKGTASTAFSACGWAFRTPRSRSPAARSIWLKRQPWRKTGIDHGPSTPALSSRTPASGNFQSRWSRAPSLAGECSPGASLVTKKRKDIRRAMAL